MIPAPRYYGFENMAHAFDLITIAVLAALLLTVLYILWIEYGKSRKE